MKILAAFGLVVVFLFVAPSFLGSSFASTPLQTSLMPLTVTHTDNGSSVNAKFTLNQNPSSWNVLISNTGKTLATVKGFSIMNNNFLWFWSGPWINQKFSTSFSLNPGQSEDFVIPQNACYVPNPTFNSTAPCYFDSTDIYFVTTQVLFPNNATLTLSYEMYANGQPQVSNQTMQVGWHSSITSSKWSITVKNNGQARITDMGATAYGSFNPCAYGCNLPFVSMYSMTSSLSSGQMITRSLASSSTMGFIANRTYHVCVTSDFASYVTNPTNNPNIYAYNSLTECANVKSS